jgi:hypothetical protein
MARERKGGKYVVVGSGDDLLVVELYAAHGTVVAKESVRTCHSLDIPHLHHLRFEPQQVVGIPNS